MGGVFSSSAPPHKSSKVFLEGRFETTPDTNNLVCPLGFHVDYAGKKLLLCPNNVNRSVYLSHKREIEWIFFFFIDSFFSYLEKKNVWNNLFFRACVTENKTKKIQAVAVKKKRFISFCVCVLIRREKNANNKKLKNSSLDLVFISPLKKSRTRKTRIGANQRMKQWMKMIQWMNPSLVSLIFNFAGSSSSPKRHFVCVRPANS